MTCGCSGTGSYDLCINQGASYERTFQWIAGVFGAAIGQGSNYVDLTGYIANMQFRPAPESSTLYYDASGDITLGGTTGNITLNISAADTETFTWGAAVYDLLLTSPAGVATRLLQGNVIVNPGVTT